MSSQSFTTPAIFIVNADVLPISMKTDRLRAASGGGEHDVTINVSHAYRTFGHPRHRAIQLHYYMLTYLRTYTRVPSSHACCTRIFTTAATADTSATHARHTCTQHIRYKYVQTRYKTCTQHIRNKQFAPLPFHPPSPNAHDALSSNVKMGIRAAPSAKKRADSTQKNGSPRNRKHAGAI